MPDPSPPPPTPVPSGIAADRLLAGRYRLVRLLARGGMAEVWEATDEVLARPVAVKLLHAHLAADDGFVSRFKHEAVAAARLSHPNIVSIYDTCTDGGTEAIVMELVPGRTLRDVFDERGAIPHQHAAGIAVQIASALECAHSYGVVHRDVKPGNILLTDDGRVLVADFGIAKAQQADGGDLTATGSVIGTAKYLAPEQVRGEAVDGRTDVYALGVVLYEMLTGRPPFEGDGQLATAVMRLSVDPLLPRQHRAGIPREVEDVVLKAMARDPGSRYASAAELKGALERIDAAPTDDDHTSALTRDSTTIGAVPLARHDGGAGHGQEPSFASTERSWLVPTAVILLVAAALGVIGVLVGRTDVGRSLFAGARDAVQRDDPGDAGPAPQIVGAKSFDPEGDGGENDDELRLLTDGDPSTAWSTERYDSAQDFRGLKDGVGVILVLDRAAELGTLELTSPTRGWSAEVYVADTEAGDIGGWGEPVTTRADIGGNVSFELGDARGRLVLVWITAIDPSSRRVEIGQARLVS